MVVLYSLFVSSFCTPRGVEQYLCNILRISHLEMLIFFLWANLRQILYIKIHLKTHKKSHLIVALFALGEFPFLCFVDLLGIGRIQSVVAEKFFEIFFRSSHDYIVQCIQRCKFFLFHFAFFLQQSQRNCLDMLHISPTMSSVM